MRWAAVASLTAAVTLAAAGSAFAAPTVSDSFRNFEIPASVYLRAHAAAGGAYELRLSAFRMDVPTQNDEPARRASYVGLELAKPGAAAEYTARERRFEVDGRVAAGWGSYGRLAARFVPLHVHREPVPGCEGSNTVETGRLVGRLRFRGEQGFATVTARSVPATVTRQPKMECHFPPAKQAQGSHGSASVSGSFGRRSRQLGVTVELHRRLGTLTVYAYSWARRGGIRVTRHVSAVAPLTDLELDPEAETAELIAPSPFTGSATYRAFPGKEAGTWRGDLAVDFPGEPGVRLAGKRFEGAKLKPGACGPDEPHSFCSSSKLLPPIALKPAQPLGG